MAKKLPEVLSFRPNGEVRKSLQALLDESDTGRIGHKFSMNTFLNQVLADYFEAYWADKRNTESIMSAISEVFDSSASKKETPKGGFED